MKFLYDDSADALYIEVESAVVAQTHQVDAGTLVDLDNMGNLVGIDNMGNLVGIEVVRPARPWPVEEIASRFGLCGSEKAILDSLWGETRKRGYPFAKPLRLGA